ncbi:MAG TPA: PDZ domain-containing protein, partial [Pyrinomonadaceae bacterium]|nr:PDZ domain-containing protein [Pyrinomonadaceae bacterium]
VYVDPSTPAFAAGLQPGDVIRSINGRLVLPQRRPFLTAIEEASTLRFEIVRNKEKRTITVANPTKKK